jgi:hypothetical protein
MPCERFAALPRYCAVVGDCRAVELVEQMLADPANSFGIEPMGIIKHAESMRYLGMIRHIPSHWQEMFPPPVADRSGS